MHISIISLTEVIRLNYIGWLKLKQIRITLLEVELVFGFALNIVFYT